MASTDVTTLQKTIEATLREFLLGYQTAKEHNDPSFISRALAPECIRYIAPVSFLTAMGAPTDFTFDVKSYQAQFAKELPVQGVNKTEINDIIIDAVGRKASASTVFHGKYSSSEKLKLEFAWFLDFNEDGTKVTRILEWLDTTEALKFQAKCNALIDELEAKQ
ncbi:hypothetical protein C8035_v000596 [Colletotrichum spinosum]|uniref:Uncharacterized protein n=1 Tax=Colletotrichum spinosum TaxID=1347390 RepID=A0A4R8QD51_9PEZI|nr:hypothetical protein C8035_v000596 [Colletotrichum spinosum]